MAKSYYVKITSDVHTRNNPDSNATKGILVKKGYQYVVTTTTKKNGKTWYKLQANQWVSENYIKVTKTVGSDSNKKTDKKDSSNKSSNAVMNAKELKNEVKTILQNSENAKLNKVDGSMRMFGLPHQFTDKTDVRLGDTGLGTMFTQTFILNAPVVYVKPGVSNFLPGLSKVEKENTINTIIASATGKLGKEFGQALSGMKDDDYRYFDFKGDFAGYMRLVNVLCRTCAVFLGIADDKVPWDEGSTWGNYDWSNYTFSTLYGVSNKAKGNGSIESDLQAFAVNTYNKLTTDVNHVQFYVDANASYSENASNSTTQSMISQYTDSLQSIGKELAFVSGVSGVNIDEAIAGGASAVDDVVNNLASGEGEFKTFLRRLTGTGTQILKGSNFLAPDIWSSSDYSKSYSFTITLSSPYGNVYSRYINIMVPLMFILGFTLPVQTSANTFGAPYLVKTWAPGWYSCDLGIVDSISIDKAPSGDSWNIDGCANEVRVSLQIRDLYANLAVPDIASSSEFKLLFSNTGLLDYLMVNCGLNLTKANFDKKVDLFVNLFKNNVSDTVSHITNFEFMGGVMEQIRSLFGIGQNW